MEPNSQARQPPCNYKPVDWATAIVAVSHIVVLVAIVLVFLAMLMLG